jgi:hypothetical protein
LGMQVVAVCGELVHHCSLSSVPGQRSSTGRDSDPGAGKAEQGIAFREPRERSALPEPDS